MPLINPITEAEASAKVDAMFGQLRKSFGKVLNFFGVMARRPQILNAWQGMYQSIVLEGTISQRHKQLAFSYASFLNACEYCYTFHSELARQAGISQEQLDALPFYRYSPLFDEQEKATLLYAERVTKNSSGMRDENVEPLKAYYSDDEIVELTMTICLANFDNRYSNSMQLEIDIP